MVIRFPVGEVPAEFRNNALTGRAELELGQQTVKLQDPYKFSTHFQLGTTRSWTTHADGHEVTIVKRRPRFIAGFRHNAFTVSVDGAVIAEATGR
jgi:hypothetical protein